MSGIRFCDACSNIFHAKEAKDEKKILFYCKSCKNEETVDIDEAIEKKLNIISQKDFIQTAQEALVDSDLILDPSMPREKVICPRCAFYECAFTFVNETNANRLRKIYLCGSVFPNGKPKCKNKFEPVKYLKTSLETFSYREVVHPDFTDSKKVLVLIHGNYTSSYIFERLLAKFESGEMEEFRILAPDLRGFGHSSYNKPATKLDDLVRDLETFLSELKIEVCYVLGWDVGAAIAAKLAATKGKVAVKKLILVNPVGAYGTTYCKDPHDDEAFAPEWTNMFDENDQRFKMLTEAYAEQNKAEFGELYKNEFFTHYHIDDNRLDSYMENFMKQKNFKDFINCQIGINLDKAEKDELPGTLGDIEAPTLILAGRDDKRTTWEDAKELEKKIIGATFNIIEDAGHCLMLEKPDFLDEIKQFCDEDEL